MDADSSQPPTDGVSEKRPLCRVAAWVIGFSLIMLALAYCYIDYRVNHRKGHGLSGRAMNLEHALECGIDGYFSEYGKLPAVPSGAHLIDTDSAEGIQFINGLLGREAQGAALQNPKGIAFLSVAEGRNNKSGMVFARDGHESLQGIFDPWGNPYHILLDLDRDGIIELPGGGKVTGHRAVIYSAGLDRKLGTRDDVNSWETR